MKLIDARNLTDREKEQFAAVLEDATAVAVDQGISVDVVDDPEDGYAYCPTESRKLLYPCARLVVTMVLPAGVAK